MITYRNWGAHTVCLEKVGYHLAVHASRHVKQLGPEQGIVRTYLTALAQVTCNLSWCLGSKPAPEYKLPDWWLDWSWWNTLWQKPTRRQQTLQIPYINMLANPFHTLSPKKDKPTWYTYIVCQINTNHAKLHQAEKLLIQKLPTIEWTTETSTYIQTTQTCLSNHTGLFDTQTWQLKTEPAMWHIRTHEDSYILQNFFKLRSLFRSC
jgi:hypothetical protein